MQVAESCTRLFLLDKPLSLLWDSATLPGAGKGRQETDGSSLAGSVPRGTWNPLGSDIMVRLLCLCGTCKHRDGVETGPRTKAVCQLPCSEGRHHSHTVFCHFRSLFQLAIFQAM